MLLPATVVHSFLFSSGIIYIEIPQFDGGKDTSDYYKVFGKQKFKETFHQLIIDATADFYSDLPF